MKNRDFKRLRRRKDAQTIKEEFMKGKYGTLTPKQLETICNEGLGYGCIAFGKSMSIEKMLERRDKLEASRKGIKKKRESLMDKINKMFK